MSEDGKFEEVNLQAATVGNAINSKHMDRKASLEALFRAHDSLIFQAAFRITGSAQDAEDVLQTVFMRLLKHETLPRQDEAQKYFYRAAINAALDLIRKRRHLRLVSIGEHEEETLSSGKGNPEEARTNKEARHQLRRAVGSLGDTAGQMFTLRYFEGLDNGRIAEIMETTPSVVGVTLHRTREKLKKLLNTLAGGR